jgi:hypothetical protein
MKYKIGFVGFGKRAKSTYFPMIKQAHSLLSVVGFHVRNAEKGKNIALENNIEFFVHARDLLEKAPDCLVVSVPYTAQHEVLKSLGPFDGTILVDTPVMDPRMTRDFPNVGVIEQWPYLPLEQFKNIIYESGKIERPFFVQNDCRSLDYHAISKLRTYVGREHFPATIASQGLAVPMPAFIDKSGNKREEPESWDMGLVKMTNGAVMSHNFSYNCKAAPFRMVHTLRGYSRNGTIITGMIDEKDNDYEKIDIRYLEGTETKHADVVINRTPSGSITTIEDKNSDLVWINRFSEFDLTDHQVAIAEIIVSACEGKVCYTTRDSLVDSTVIAAIRQSAHQEVVWRFD